MTSSKLDDITTKLKEAFIKAGKKLTYEEAQKEDGLPDLSEYAFHYGTYDEAANYVWRSINPAGEGPMNLTPMAMAMIKKKREEQEKKS